MVREKAIAKMREVPVVLILAILYVAALSLAACGGKRSANSNAAPVTVHVKLTEFKVDVDRNTVPAGPVKFVIANEGTIVHEVVLEPAGATDQPFKANGKVAEAADIERGQSGTLAWTLDTRGEYQLGCHVPGHYEAGMVATFTVSAPQ